MIVVHLKDISTAKECIDFMSTKMKASILYYSNNSKVIDSTVSIMCVLPNYVHIYLHSSEYHKVKSRRKNPFYIFNI